MTFQNFGPKQKRIQWAGSHVLVNSQNGRTFLIVFVKTIVMPQLFFLLEIYKLPCISWLYYGFRHCCPFAVELLGSSAFILEIPENPKQIFLPEAKIVVQKVFGHGITRNRNNLCFSGIPGN